MSKSLKCLSIEITQQCNLDCDFCFLGNKEQKDIDLPKLNRFLYKNLDYIEKTIILTGGEPFLKWKTISKIIKLCRKFNKKIYVITNGSWNSKILDSMENKPDALKISLDFPDERHDDYRGKKGLFNNSLYILNKAKNSGIATEILCTITKKNLGAMNDMLDFSRELHLNLSFNRYIPSSLSDPLMLDKNELKEFFGFIRKHKVDYVGGLSCFTGDKGHLCTAGLNKAHITIQGYITPCMFYPQKYGTISESLRKVHERMIDARVERAMRAEEECKNCIYLGPECRGDCIPIANLYGNIKGQCLF